MTAPMLGTRDVTVTLVRPFTIHGDEYLELHVTGPDGDAAFRVPRHAYVSPSEPGDRVRLTFLMGQVTKVERV